MNRTDRLFAIVTELRIAEPDGRTSKALAERFELSARTIKRDITALQEAGYPIWSTPGPGGGYRILDTATIEVDLSFTPAEAAAVAIALGSQQDLPYALEARTALTKVLASLSADERADVDDLVGRVWSRTQARPPQARVVDRAVRERLVVVIDYRDAHGELTTRRVDPLQLVLTAGHWYLLGYCRRRDAGRWFRLDRITDARLTTEPADDHDVATVIGSPPPDAHPLTDRVQTTNRARPPGSAPSS